MKWAQAHFFISPSYRFMPALEKDELLGAISELSELAAAGTDIEIADVELRGSGGARLLRVYIDKPAGVTHGDCEIISERLGSLLDERDVMPEGSYTLEVSSPGIERALKKPRDFERVVGRNVKLSLKEPMGGQKRLEGKLVEIAGASIGIELSTGERIRVKLDQVQKANLKFEW
jgi:ribosome maturation factor RimP